MAPQIKWAVMAKRTPLRSALRLWTLEIIALHSRADDVSQFQGVYCRIANCVGNDLAQQFEVDGIKQFMECGFEDIYRNAHIISGKAKASNRRGDPFQGRVTPMASLAPLADSKPLVKVLLLKR